MYGLKDIPRGAVTCSCDFESSEFNDFLGEPEFLLVENDAIVCT